MINQKPFEVIKGIESLLIDNQTPESKANYGGDIIPSTLKK